MSAAALRPIGPIYMVARVRRAKCAVAGCSNRTRLALALPLADIDDGKPGLGGVRLCVAHLEEKVVVVSDDERRRNR